MEKEKNRFLSVLKKSWSREFFVWLVVFLLLTISNVSLDLLLSLELSALFVSGMLLLSLINRFFLIPYLLRRERIFFYLLVSVVVLTGTIICFTFCNDLIVTEYITENINSGGEWSPLDCRLPSESKPFFDAAHSESRVTISSQLKIAILFITTFFITILFHYLRKEEKDEKSRQNLLREKTEMELKFLKSQINPHFLFNALNNVYSMIYMRDKNAPDSVLMLSEMLRYVTDECREEKILLRDEIHYLENYINFQQFSYEKTLDVSFVKDVNKETIYVSPMLLQPFVENSFKYSGIGMEAEAYIRVSLRVKDNILSFTVENSKKKKNKKENVKKREGVGLQNVKKRLQLLYPEKHKLEMKETEETFIVNLILIIV